MKEKILKVKPKCTSPTFGLKLARDKLYGCTYVHNIEKKSSAVHFFSLLQVTCNVIHSSFLVEIAGHCICMFSKL